MRDARRVNVLLAESGRTVGGTERVLWELATRLPASRFDVRVWLSDAPGVDPLADSLRARGLPVERVPEVDSRWDWRGLAGTWARLRKARPDLLHIHHVWPAADRYLAWLAAAAGVPHLVVTEHITGQSHSPGQRALKRRELRQADAVTAVCGAVADSLVRDYGVARGIVRVVPNGADLPDEEHERPLARKLRDQLGAGPFRPLWVCPARLETQKGHATLIDALARVKSKSIEFVAVLAGEGSLRESLAARVSEAGLSDRVHMPGVVDPLGPLLAACDACLLPSLWEGLPLVVLEALARGKPVVASRVGGIPEAIEDGVTGRLVPPGDPAALAAVLEDFHRRADAAARLGHAGAERVHESFTWDKVVEAFETVYDEVLGLASFSPEAPDPERHRAPERSRARAERPGARR